MSDYVMSNGRPANSYPDDPKIMLSVSDDGGITWSEYMPRSMGRIGEYQTRVKWNRLGAAPARVMRFALSDPAPLTVMDLSVEVEGAAR
jgi:hypothetical protein